MNNITKKSYFTLIELTISFVILSIVCVLAGNIYSNTIKATNDINSKTIMFENARIAMDLMTRDIQSIYFEKDATPFWHYKHSDGTGEFIAFASASSVIPNSHNTSICEVKYKVNDDGWIQRSITSSNDDDYSWNYNKNFNYSNNNLNVGSEFVDSDSDGKNDNVFTINDDGNEPYRNLTPYVTKLEFTCFRRKGNKYDINGSVRISPNNSGAKQFIMHTPSGIIDRNTLKNGGSSYSYDNSASYIKLISIGNLKVIMVNGESLDISGNTPTEITSSEMTIKIDNLNAPNGASMGQWKITINAKDATITPKPPDIIIPNPFEEVIEPYNDTHGASYNCYQESGGITGEFPYSIQIDLTLLDKNSWSKWKTISDSLQADNFKKQHERKFTKIVLIGDRGQYD